MSISRVEGLKRPNPDVTSICCDDHRKCDGTLQGAKGKVLERQNRWHTQLQSVRSKIFINAITQLVTTYHTDEQ